MGRPRALEARTVEWSLAERRCHPGCTNRAALLATLPGTHVVAVVAKPWNGPRPNMGCAFFMRVLFAIGHCFPAAMGVCVAEVENQRESVGRPHPRVERFPAT